ncbi:MAG: DUF4307 domain-containing protein [Actinomycetota bacterium]|nr:DUF4307 domain-containing protein [Actinomycetota bacterium]
MSQPTEPGGERQTLQERYGVRPAASRRVTVALVSVVAALGLGWLGWAAWSQATPDVSAALRSFDVVSPHEVEVVIDVHRASGDAVRCDVSAQADDHSVVGEDDVVVPAGDQGDLRISVTLRTSRRATIATVGNCR